MAYHWWNITFFFYTFQIWWTEEGFFYEQLWHFTQNHLEIMNINLRRYQTHLLYYICNITNCLLTVCIDSPDSLPSHICVHAFVFFFLNPVDNLFFKKSTTCLIIPFLTNIMYYRSRFIEASLFCTYCFRIPNIFLTLLKCLWLFCLVAFLGKIWYLFESDPRIRKILVIY